MLAVSTGNSVARNTESCPDNRSGIEPEVIVRALLHLGSAFGNIRVRM